MNNDICQTDFECGDRESCLDEGLNVNGSCACSEILGYVNLESDCTEFASIYIVFYVVVLFPRLIFQLFLLFRISFVDRTKINLSNVKALSSIRVARTLLLISLALSSLAEFTQLIVYFTPDGFQEAASIDGNVKIDRRRLYSSYIFILVYIIVIFLNAFVALIWIQNAERLKELNPLLKSKIARRIKQVLLGYSVFNVVLTAFLFAIKQTLLLFVTLPLIGFSVISFVQFYCSRKFLKMLIIVSDEYIDSPAYQKVKKLRNTVFASFLMILVSTIIIAATYRGTIQGEIDKFPFPYVFTSAQIARVAIVLNIYGLHRYIYESFLGKALFEATRDGINNSVLDLSLVAGAYDTTLPRSASPQTSIEHNSS